MRAAEGQGEAWLLAHADYPHKDCCLIWPFGGNSTGYGLVTFRGQNQTYAHRAMCILVNGEPPTPNHQAAHSCGRGTDGCVSPHHLSWKTPSENQFDRTDLRHRAKRKLTAEQVDDIRACKGRENVNVTAERHNVNEITIRRIQAGQLWRSDRRIEHIFTEAQVHRIRRPDERLADLAREFNVGYLIVWRIRKRQNYAYVPEEGAVYPSAFRKEEQ